MEFDKIRGSLKDMVMLADAYDKVKIKSVVKSEAIRQQMFRLSHMIDSELENMKKEIR